MQKFHDIKGRIALFAGTSEGRETAEIYARSPVAENFLDVYVTTDYGAAALPKDARIRMHVGCLLREAMLQSFRREPPVLVIDATHPYASHITETLTAVCTQLSLPYLRIRREMSLALPEGAGESIRLFSDFTALVDFLRGTEGGILITSGAKELPVFAALPDFSERCYLRALPTATVLQTAGELGLSGSHLFLMQGPFSREMNLALLQHCGARFMVSKFSGPRGGFEEKREAAEAAGVTLLLVGRPEESPLPPLGETCSVENLRMCNEILSKDDI